MLFWNTISRSYLRRIKMNISNRIILTIGFFLAMLASSALALQPDQILVIANNNNPDSMRLAKYYCRKRSVPQNNILALNLGSRLKDQISRNDYNKIIATAVRQRLSTLKGSEKIKCLLTLYGVPYKVGPRKPLADRSKDTLALQKLFRPKSEQLANIISQVKAIANPDYHPPAKATPAIQKAVRTLQSDFDDALKRARNIQEQTFRQQHLQKWLSLHSVCYGKVNTVQIAKEKLGIAIPLTDVDQLRFKQKAKLFKQAKSENWPTDKKIANGYYQALETISGLTGQILQLTNDIDMIKGIETDAALDSELSMVMFEPYELYRWQPNELKQRLLWIGVKTLMVSRIDAPTYKICQSLIDKAIATEAKGLNGNAYFDSGKTGGGLYDIYDQYIKDAAELFRKDSSMKVTQQQTLKLFAPGTCPDTAIYCGWYSLRKYIDAFDFVDGAVGYHIASLEATKLRSATSAQWCPAMLRDGITATIGAVAEPYLGAFPPPQQFFRQLLRGRTLAEAYYKTNPYNSWQMLLIGDPLYAPFK